jgi:transcriptional regulator with XRE-family HTH domain
VSYHNTVRVCGQQGVSTMHADDEIRADRAALGRELRRLRESRGLTQAGTARAVGLSARSAVADYESGRRTPPHDILRNYERAFELPLGALHHRRAALDPAPPPPPEPSPPRPARSGTRWPVRVVLLLGVFAALSGSAPTAALGLDPTWDARTEHVRDHALAATQPEPMDGDDPRARDCVPDAVVVQSVPLTLPGGAPFGTLRLRHSDHCGTSWGSAYYTNPELYTIRIAVHRPADNAIVHDEWSNNTPPGSYSDMLSTAPGCVWTEAVVVTPAGESAPARTPCS